MHLKSLLLFIASASGFFPSGTSYALSKVSTPQDSVKKISITVIASEKPREVNFDSLLRSTATTKSTKTRRVNKIEQTYKSKPAELKAEIQKENEISNSQSSDQENLGHQSANSSSNTTVAKQVQKPSSNIDEHSEEIKSTSATDDTVLHEAKTARTYLWIGFMLIVVGIILGILFGKTALLVSIAGVVFVIIGYTI